MKTKCTTSLTTVIMLSIFAAAVSNAQQPFVKQQNPAPAHLSPATSNYTYKIFQAPNKSFGYDILRNGKLVYHEFASMSQPENISQSKNFNAPKLNSRTTAPAGRENLALVKKEHAEKAALLAIEKIKRKEPPMLNQDEVRKIIAQ